MENSTFTLENTQNVIPSIVLTDESKEISNNSAQFFTPNTDTLKQADEYTTPVPTTEFQSKLLLNQDSTDPPKKRFRKSKYHNQPKRELISSIKRCSRQEIYINLFNVDESACDADIKDFYPEVNIAKVIKNTNKTGNWDLKFTNREEAIKLVLKGNGMIKDRVFFIRDSYRNNFIYDDTEFFDEMKFSKESSPNFEESSTKPKFNPFLESMKKGAFNTPVSSVSTFNSSAAHSSLQKENVSPNVQSNINTILKGIFEGMNDDEIKSKENPLMDFPLEFSDFKSKGNSKGNSIPKGKSFTSTKKRVNKLR